MEIEVYSTVGASWYNVSQFGGVFGVKCGKDVVKVCCNGCGIGWKWHERCSEDGGALAFCKIPTHG